MGPEIVDDLAAWSTRGKGRSLGVFIVLDRGVRGNARVGKLRLDLKFQLEAVIKCCVGS